MKTNSIFLTSAALIAGLALSSCTKSLEKSEVESGFKTFAEPQIEIVEYKINADASITATINVSGVDESAIGNEVSILISNSEDFKVTRSGRETLKNGTITVTGNGFPKSKNYVQVGAAYPTGVVYGDVTTFDVPDVAFYLKLPGTYTAKGVPDYWGEDTYNITAVIEADPSDPEHKCFVNNLEPYLATNGLVAPKYQHYAGTIDKTAKTVTIADETPTGYSTWVLAIASGPGIVLEFDEDCTAFTINYIWGVYTGTGWANLFKSGVTCSK